METASGAAPAIQQEGAALDGELPQPFAGIAVLLDTIAVYGMKAKFDGGIDTPNATLCKRFASELRAALAAPSPAQPSPVQGDALSQQVALVIEWLIAQGHMDWRSDGADESGHEDGFNSNEEEAATLRHYVADAIRALAAKPAGEPT